MNELREFGDKKTVVLFSDENKVAQALKNLDRVYKCIPYEQKQRNKVVLIGYDFCFNKKWRKWLEKRVSGLSFNGIRHS